MRHANVNYSSRFMFNTSDHMLLYSARHSERLNGLQMCACLFLILSGSD